MEVNDSGKRSSSLQYSKIYNRKKVLKYKPQVRPLTRGEGYKILFLQRKNKVQFLTLARPFQPSLMFLGKARAYPSEAPFSYFTQMLIHGFIHKH